MDTALPCRAHRWDDRQSINPCRPPLTTHNFAVSVIVPTSVTPRLQRICSGVPAAAGASSDRQKRSTRNAQLYELSGDDGWGVEISAQSSTPQQPQSKQQQPVTRKHTAAKAPAGRRRGTRFADIRSEEGRLGMTVLQRMLMEQETAGDAAAENGAHRGKGCLRVCSYVDVLCVRYCFYLTS